MRGFPMVQLTNNSGIYDSPMAEDPIRSYSIFTADSGVISTISRTQVTCVLRSQPRVWRHGIWNTGESATMGVGGPARFVTSWTDIAFWDSLPRNTAWTKAAFWR